MTIPLSYWKSKQDYQFLDPADYPTYGYSFWLRNPNYTGNCIRVRRTSDNTEQDIGFVNNFLDTASLLTFVGASNGFVVTFYDQFGSINLTNAYPGDNGYMPFVVSAGVLTTFVNGEATIQFGQGSTASHTPLVGGIGTNMLPNTNSTVFWSEENGNSVSNQLLGNNNNDSIFGRRQISDSAGTTTNFDIGVAENYFVNESKLIEGFETSLIATANDLYNVISYRTATDGARLLAIRGIGYNALGTGIVLGGRYTSATTYFRGKCNELLLYAGSTLSEAKVIEIQSILNSSHEFYDSTSVYKDLVLWYDAGNTSSYPGSGTTISNLAPETSAGATLVGPTYSSSDGGKFVFNGAGDWIGTSNTNEYPFNVRSGDFTIECWVRPNNVNQTSIIFGNRNNSTFSQLAMWIGNCDAFGNISSGKKISAVLTNPDVTRASFWASDADVIDGNWKHLVLTRTDRTFKLYVNSVDTGISLQGGVGGTNLIYVDTTAISWRMSDRGDGTGGGVGGNYSGDGSIYRLYKCKLTQEQVTRNFDLERSRYGL